MQCLLDHIVSILVHQEAIETVASMHDLINHFGFGRCRGELKALLDHIAAELLPRQNQNVTKELLPNDVVHCHIFDF